jgi:hypothetical protein
MDGSPCYFVPNGSTQSSFSTAEPFGATIFLSLYSLHQQVDSITFLDGGPINTIFASLHLFKGSIPHTQGLSLLLPDHPRVPLVVHQPCHFGSDRVVLGVKGGVL